MTERGMVYKRERQREREREREKFYVLPPPSLRFS